MKHRLLVCVLVVLSFTGASVVFSETETERKIRVTKWDKENLRYSTGVATDTSKELIKIPDGYPGKQDFVVAKKGSYSGLRTHQGTESGIFPRG